MSKNKIKLTIVSAFHYYKLIGRSALFLVALIIYIINKVTNTGEYFFGAEKDYILLGVIWTIFVIEMLLRMFPSKTESIGCQKQFKHTYIPKEENTIISLKTKPISTFICFIAWIALNSIFGVLYYLGIFDTGIMLLISLAYSVCDMICILFFCPFQTWIMKNKCCATCRIYNWDYIMMFTPLIFIPHIYTWSIIFIALLLLFRWEIAYKMHPERFIEGKNKALDCVNCNEKLCTHKKQLQSFLKKRMVVIQKKINAKLKKNQDN